MATAKKATAKKKTTAKKKAAKKTTVKKAAPKKTTAKKTTSSASSASKKATTTKTGKSAKKTTSKKKTTVKKAAPKKYVKKGKKNVIEGYQAHAKDTGSPKVQVALLTDRINSLTEHLKEHKKDNHSRRGLILMVGKRRRLLRYIASKDKDLYETLTDELKIRK